MIQGEAMPTIGLIGLGNAGRPIAERIVAKGYSLAVYDLNPGAVERLAQLGAHRANSAREAVRDITLTVLPSSVEVRQAVFGEYGALSAINSSMTFIDLSGTDPDCARDVENRLEDKQGAFLGGTIYESVAASVVMTTWQFEIS